MIFRESDDDIGEPDEALKAEISGKASGDIRFEFWDGEWLKNYVDSNNIESFLEFQNALKEYSESTWATQVGQLEQEINSSSLPGDEADSDLISADIELQGNVLEFSLETHSKGHHEYVAVYRASKTDDHYSDTLEKKVDLKQSEIVLSVLKKAINFFNENQDS